ncbi:type II toxin-antitoxin system VapC family toxin [Acidiferrobacter sp.]|uniref:type II toxin-antitoxin system VapC family toxin n=1 Tax=Acidiferrobacter sp. TaxID=1872107 RepID=UPI0026020001|nr:type II toxin-antitoxin system VapC family toxin [Acidiferrobacter sp.]
MVVDSSALIGILLGESEADTLARALAYSVDTVMTAANWLETALVITSRVGSQGERLLGDLMKHAGVQVVAVDSELARLALMGWLRFGRGRHPAGLNFGDCFSYALARQRGEPLLFKGDDFGKTDVTPVV